MKQYTFEFSKKGLEKAVNFKAEHNLIKYAPLAVGVIAITYMIYTMPVAVAGLGTVEEVAKQAFKLKVGGI